MAVAILNSLLLAIIGMPLMVSLSDANSIKRRKVYIGFVFCYFAFALNEIIFINFPKRFYFYHVVGDCILLASAFLLLLRVEHPGFKFQTKTLGLLYGLLSSTIALTCLVYAYDSNEVNILAAINMIVAGLIFYLLIFKTMEEKQSSLLPLILLWIICHLGFNYHNLIFNRVLTIIFFGMLSWLIGIRMLKVHRKIEEENSLLIRAREIIVSMLNDISSSERDILSIEYTLNRILETIIETLNIEGAAIFQIDKTLSSEPVLKFSQSAGLFWPIHGNVDQVFIRKSFVKETLRKSVFKMGEGVVGIVAQSQKPINLDRDKDRQQMLKLGLNVRNIRNILSVPLKVKDQVLGVLVVQNHKSESFFSPQDLNLLQSLADQAASSINNVNMYAELAKTDRIRQEMRIAADIQKQLLPKTIPIVKNCCISAFFKPAKEVGGDYYDFLPNSDGTLGIVIGDVSGKGLPAGMMMVIAHAALEVIARDNRDTKEIVNRFSREMYTKMNRGQFITLNYLLWDGEKRILYYTGAGHEHLLWYRSHSASVEKIRAGGIAVGLVDDTSNITKENSIQTNSGDIIVLYTDGITEARNKNEEMFTLDRLLTTVITHACLQDSEKISNNIMQNVFDFMGGMEQYDDMTLLVLSVT